MPRIPRRSGRGPTLSAGAALAALSLAACGAQDGSPRARVERGVVARAARAAATTTPRAAATTGCPDARIIGQKLMVSFRGRSAPPAALLRRIRRGEVGGVILFAENAPPAAAAVARLTRRLQAAARAGGQPPLLIATDQEGGTVRRVPGPPRASGAEMGRLPPAELVRLGAGTGRSLRSMGIDVDLAPVADVRGSAGSFLGSRAFGTTPAGVARATTAFAGGLQRAGVAATAKHYPGLGRTGAANTDAAVVRVATARAVLERDRSVFVAHARRGTRLMMVSSAIYDAYDRARPAVLSRRVIGGLRRGGFRGVVVSDDLETPPLRATGENVPAAATRAGVDLLLYASSDGAAAYRALRSEVCAHRVSHAQLQAQVRRIIALKQALARP